MCPICQSKISMDYSKRGVAYTDGIYNISTMTPGLRDAGRRSVKPGDTYMMISICTHCKGILGVSRGG